MRQTPVSVNNRSVAVKWSTSPQSTVGRSNAAVTHWSSDAYRPGEARTAWLDLFAQRYGAVARDNTHYQRPFRLRMESYRLGSVAASFVETSWTRLCRDSSAETQDAYWLFQPRAGATLCRVPRGEFVVRDCECFLLNLGEPFSIECNQPNAGLSLIFPRQWLARWLSRPERCSPHFQNKGDWSGALCNVVSTLHPESIAKLALPAASVAENIAVLLTLAAGPDSQARGLPLLESLRGTLVGSLH